MAGGKCDEDDSSSCAAPSINLSACRKGSLPASSCSQLDTWDAKHPAGSPSLRTDSKCRFHSAVKGKLDFNQISDPISHTHSPLPIRPAKVMNCTASSDAAGAGGSAHCILKQGTITGPDDMHPAATRPQLITDRAPSKEYVRHNEMKAHIKPAAIKSHTKADRPVSDEYKKRNDTHALPTRGPRRHQPGEKPPSSELQHFNDHAKGMAQWEGRKARLNQLYHQQYRSNDVFHGSQASRPMSNAVATSSSSAGASTGVSSSIPEGSRTGVNSIKKSSHGPDNASSCSRSLAETSIGSTSAADSTFFAPPSRRQQREENEQKARCPPFAEFMNRGHGKAARQKRPDTARSSCNSELSVSAGAFSMSGFSYDRVSAR